MEEEREGIKIGHAEWPSSSILSQWIVENEDVLDGVQTVLEMGCGVSALPSKTIKSLRPSISVITQDILPKVASIQADWHDPNWTEGLPPRIDLVLGADIFYEEDDFAAIMASIDRIFREHACSKVITCYHLRQPKATIWPYLSAYGMQASVLSRSDPFILIELFKGR